MTSRWLLRACTFLLLALNALACHAAGPRGVPVLTYHQVTDAKPAGVTVITPDAFARQMQYLADQHYQTLSIDELVAVMRGRQPMPAKPVVLTFDDGWRSVLSVVPVLDKHGFKASFWIMPGYVGQGEYMDWTQIRRLVANRRYEVGSHSFTHPLAPDNNFMTWMEGRPAGKGPADVRAELVLSKRVLEAQLGRPVRYFAWPQGLYNDAMVELARQAGYEAVLTSDEMPGNAVGADVFRIRRMAVHGACDVRAFAAQLADFVARSC